MRTIYGFYRFTQQANNAPGIIATFGEIERLSMTYTVEDRNYKYPEYPNVDLVTLQVADELGQPIQPSEEVTKQINAIGDWIYTQHAAGLIPGEDLKQQFYSSMRVEFGDVEWLGLGEITRSRETGFNMPTSVEYIITDNGYEYHVKIWLSNESLRLEYEPFRIYIIPPIDVIDSFNSNPQTVANLLSKQTPKTLLDKYNAIRGDNPDTRFDIYELTWHDPEDQTTTLTTQWSYVAYGVGATTIDSIKNAIRDYIAANSKTSNWLKIFPSLYDENDFTIIPLWDKIAVPETNLDQNLYSSFSTIGELMSLAKRLTPASYGSVQSIDEHLSNHLEVWSTFYRGMMLMSIGNPANVKQTKRLSMLYPDYSSVPPSSDFERMEEKSRTFSELLNIALEHARVFAKNSTPPHGFYRVMRNNRTYLTFLYNGFQYMILTRESFMLGK